MVKDIFSIHQVANKWNFSTNNNAVVHSTKVSCQWDPCLSFRSRVLVSIPFHFVPLVYPLVHNMGVRKWQIYEWLEAIFTGNLRYTTLLQCLCCIYSRAPGHFHDCDINLTTHDESMTDCGQFKTTAPPDSSQDPRHKTTDVWRIWIWLVLAIYKACCLYVLWKDPSNHCRYHITESRDKYVKPILCLVMWQAYRALLLRMPNLGSLDADVIIINVITDCVGHIVTLVKSIAFVFPHWYNVLHVRGAVELCDIHFALILVTRLHSCSAY